MTDPDHQELEVSTLEVVEHHGHTIRVQPTVLEWLAVIAGPDQRPEIVLAVDREAALAMAHQWINAKSVGRLDALTERKAQCSASL
jgi:hypothetical protein